MVGVDWVEVRDQLAIDCLDFRTGRRPAAAPGRHNFPLVRERPTLVSGRPL